MKKFFKNYSLSIVLFLLFFFSWIGQLWAQWPEFVSQQEMHGAEVSVKEFMPMFWQATFENWQSEFLQLFTFVVLTTYLIHKGSHESKDSQDEMQAAIERIEKQVDKLSKKK